MMAEQTKQFQQNVIEIFTHSPNYFADEAELPSLADYNPWVTWKTKTTSEIFQSELESGKAKKVVTDYFIQDASTGYCYLDEEGGLVRKKHLALLITAPFIHFLGFIIMMGCDVVVGLTALLRATTLLCQGKLARAKHIVGQFAMRVGGIMVKPLGWGVMVASNIIGLMLPLSGKKVFASIERAVYWRPILAPCFQPLMAIQSQQKAIPADFRKQVDKVGNIKHMFSQEKGVSNTW